MFTLPGYQISESVYRSARTTVFRAQRDADALPVIIKLCHETAAEGNSLSRAQREFMLLQDLHCDALPTALDCCATEDGHALVLQDIGGQSLDQWLDDGVLPSEQWHGIARAAAEALGALQANGIIHRDLRLANLIYNRQTGALQLIDLDNATRLAQQRHSMQRSLHFIGHPDYVAPEQTGRINRVVDYRSDFYSLGACLYHLATGQPPFNASDMTGLLHAHIARKPVAAHERHEAVTSAVSGILDKLLEKSPDDRYQSAFGLLADLRACQALPQNEAAGFVPGKQDVAGQFRILDHLYGREEELTLLQQDYRKARAGTTRLTLVTGMAGIGKTVLVDALRDYVVEDAGYFVSGKFDQLRRSEPYFGPIKALTNLVSQILSEDDAQVAQWRKHILNTMGDTCSALSGLIPELKAITGVVPTTSQVPASEAMHRFNNAVRLLLQAISTFGKPVVLFLDDLQWADTPSLRTLGLMLREAELAHIHVIGAYRADEVGPGHPVQLLLDGLQAQQTDTRRLELQPLLAGDIAALLADTLSQEAADCLELAELLHGRTGGNPFFIRQMLQHLQQADLFEFDSQAGCWRWSLPQIKSAGYTRDVAEFMSGQLRALPQQQQQLLQIAACIGIEFKLELLAASSELLRAEAARALWLPLEKGLISMSGIDSGLLLIQETATLERLLCKHDVRFRFNHDRIQEAADQLLSDDARIELHLRIARLLKQQVIPEHDSRRLFNLVTHYNRAAKRLPAAEQHELAGLNLRAAIATKRSGAHDVAYGIARQGLTLLPAGAWRQDYALCLQLHQEAAELACLNADYPAMQDYLQVLESNAQSTLDKLPGYETRILAEIAQHRPYQAVKTAIPLLREFGLHLPERPRPIHVMRSFLRTRILLAGRPISGLRKLPPLQEPRFKAGVQLLSRVVSAAYFSSPLMLPLIILLLVRVSVRQGLSPLSPFAFVGYGTLLCGAGRKPGSGLAYGELGLSLAREPGYQQFANRALFLFGHYIEHWNRPMPDTCSTLQDAFEAGLRAGDQEFTAYPAALYCMHGYFAGKTLPGLREDMREYRSAIQKTQHETAQRWHEIYQASVDLLLDEDSDPGCLQTAHCTEASVEELKPSAKDAGVGFHYRLNKLMLCYLFGDYEQAEHYRARAAVDLPYLIATPYIPVYTQYAALLALARYRGNPDAALLRQAHRSLLLMRRWARDCAANYEHKAWLIEAEMAAAHGQDQDALQAYENAIDGARRNGFQNDAALAQELAGEYCLRRERSQQGQFLLVEAVNSYLQWGALRKAADIRHGDPPGAGTRALRNPQDSYDPRQLDIESVLKSARALSGEILLPRLIQKLMQLVMESGGAERAVLVTRENGQLMLQAECSAESGISSAASTRPLEERQQDLAFSIIQYVSRTHSAVVLGDAQREGEFRRDQYVRSKGCRSLLCLPLMNHGELAGLLYLENNLMAGAFTPARLEVLTVLCSQAAVSLENARLYKNISDLSNAYERFVPHDMLSLLHRNSILDVQLGDQVQGEMTALFADIRSFTSLSESMTPEQNFSFLNEYLGAMSPIIREHKGFVNRYLGDALLAIFPHSPDDAVEAGIHMLQQLRRFNDAHRAQLREPLRIGIGINSGPMMLGTVGEPDRMEGSILSDAVNIAARLETLTKTYRVPLLISGSTVHRLSRHGAFACRFIGDVLLRGREQAVAIHEVFDADPEKLRQLKRELQTDFDTAVRNYQVGDHDNAIRQLRSLKDRNPDDSVASVLLEQCESGQLPARQEEPPLQPH